MKPEELRARRGKIGWSQAKLAAEFGVTSTTIARWERGERAIPPMTHLALRCIEQDYEEGGSSCRPPPAG